MISSETCPAVVRIRLLGRMAVFHDGSEIPLPPTRKSLAILAVLALCAPRPVLRARLIGLLWSGRREAQARASLRQEIHRLREAFAVLPVPVLRIEPDRIALERHDVFVDAVAVMEATVEKPGALALMNDDLLGGMDQLDRAFELWLKAERNKIQDHVRRVLEASLNAPSGCTDIVAAATHLLRIDRTHEGAWRALMRDHAGKGERGLAIQMYRRCRTALAELCGTVPSAQTEALLAEIMR